MRFLQKKNEILYIKELIIEDFSLPLHLINNKVYNQSKKTNDIRYGI